MDYVELGNSRLKVSRVGLGCMGMSEYYPGFNEKESVATLHRAVELGINFFDTADEYGMGKNEELLGKAFKGIRDQVIIASKFGFVRDASGNTLGIDGSPRHVREACEASLKRLQTDYIDLYYLHRIDPRTPVEDTLNALLDLKDQGKIRAIGLSEASARTIERASRVAKISAVQSEYSLWTRDPEQNGVMESCNRNGISFVPFSPLGRGFLTGRFRKPGEITVDDYRSQFPRFSKENFDSNLKIVEELAVISSEKGITNSQLALAWVLSRGKNLVPIPGTKKVRYLEENARAVDVVLTQNDLSRIDEVFRKNPVRGERYSNDAMKYVDR